MDSTLTLSKALREGVKVALSYVVVAAFFLVFGFWSLAVTGDRLAFIASLPVFLAAAGVVAGWMNLIRMDADEENPQGEVVARSAHESHAYPAENRFSSIPTS